MNIDLTAAIPLYNSSPIFWLALESLCRQNTQYTWELVVCEDPSTNFCGEEYIKPYLSRLKSAGCINFKYLPLNHWIHLGEKWKYIAKNSNGENFMLVAADDYCSPNRIQRSCNLLNNNNLLWLDSRQVLYYNLLTAQEMHLTVPMPYSGVFMCTKTNLVQGITDKGPKEGVDNWLRTKLNINNNNRVSVEPYFLGFNTDGKNNISMKRRARYNTRQNTPGCIWSNAKYNIRNVLDKELYKKISLLKKSTNT